MYIKIISRMALFVLVLAAPVLAQAAEAARVFFVAGDARIGVKAVKLNDAVAEGDQLSTGADGYIYMKTADEGFLFLRPGTRARIVHYRIDVRNPANTQVKLELQNGTARSISGTAVKSARQNFRFNTPVAAIGVRGTDFSVTTDAETSRVTVLSGGIVASGFSGSCGPEGAGPCEGSGSRDLFAEQNGQMLQVRRGDVAPQLVPRSNLAPDTVAPPRADELAVGVKAAAAPVTADAVKAPEVVVPVIAATVTKVNLDVQKSAILTGLPVKPSLPVTVPPVAVNIPKPEMIWGRWRSDEGLPIQIDMAKQKDMESVAINKDFVLLRSSNADWTAPERGSAGFVLKTSEAYITNDSTKVRYTAAVQNGRLDIDFGARAFTTSLDLVDGGDTYSLRAAGTVSPTGHLTGDTQFTGSTTMKVDGALGLDKENSAAYLFQSRLDANKLATGLTTWGK
ncbi:MAG TPA: FecR domain-containing protein [Burkholderiaceae bacterium]